jgi:hypothetical protein
MPTFHNFKVGETVKVFTLFPSGRLVFMRAKIRKLLNGEDRYSVVYISKQGPRGHHDVYVDPYQNQPAEDRDAQ